jgi:class 3 adenylate cyclase
MVETLTFVTTDIEGSRRLARREPETMRLALADHDVILHNAVEAHGGTVFQTVGDGLYASFQSPTAALSAAVQSQRALHMRRWTGLGPLKIRIAIHTGGGQTALNRCLRLLDIAHGGQVLLTSTTADLVREALPAGASLRPLGAHRTRELGPLEHVFQLVHANMASEVLTLRSAWYQRWRRYAKEILRSVIQS